MSFRATVNQPSVSNNKLLMCDGCSWRRKPWVYLPAIPSIPLSPSVMWVVWWKCNDMLDIGHRSSCTLFIIDVRSENLAVLVFGGWFFRLTKRTRNNSLLPFEQCMVCTCCQNGSKVQPWWGVLLFYPYFELFRVKFKLSLKALTSDITSILSGDSGVKLTVHLNGIVNRISMISYRLRKPCSSQF